MPNGRFWAANLLIDWNFSKFPSILITAMCLECIGSMSIFQKKDFLQWRNWAKFWHRKLIWRKKIAKILHCASVISKLCSVQCTVTCGNYRNSLWRIFGKNVVKVTVLLNKLLKSWYDEIFFFGSLQEQIFREINF